MLIRVLTPADADAFKALRLRALQEAPLAFGSSYREEKDRTVDVIAGGLLAAEDKAVFGAFLDDRLIGVVGVRRESLIKFRHKGMLWGMYIAPEHRGAGLATALLHEAIQFSRNVPGLLQINLTVNATNASAVRLYQALGFQAFGREANSMMVDGALYDEIHMVLLLPSNVIGSEIAS